ncbi:MAG: DUF342 domain-containing protein [Candidatus Coatesbacteria bacterium]|nr:DUF342 domain-containing protein [Candidatus Coatesbacteria bacterium]
MEDTSTVKTYSLILSEDKMIAVLEAYAPVDVSEEEVLHQLAENNIDNGVDHEAIREFIRDCAEGEGLVRSDIARGEEVCHGEDGQIRWAHEQAEEEEAGENERIDWYEQSDLICISENDLIAEITQPTEGIDGFNVLGEKVKAMAGKPIALKPGANVNVSDDGIRFTSAINGMLVIKGRSIKVDPMLKIRADVDFEVGNIDFEGQVSIGGNVLDLFKVKSTGDITIRGCVEGAALESKSNIAIKGGIAGKNKCTINLKGDLSANYINCAKVRSQGDITVTVEILNSTIETKGSIIVKQKGIIGGQTIAAGGLECQILGSEAGPPTVVVLGKDNSKEARLNVLRMKDRSISPIIKELSKKIMLLERMKNYLPADKRELLTEMFYEKQEKEAEMEEIRTEVRTLVDETRDMLMNTSLLVKNLIYPGVVIEMGGIRKQVTELMEGPVTAKFDVAKRRILLLSKDAR